MAEIESTNAPGKRSGREDGIPVAHWDVRNLAAGGDSVGGDERYVQINGNAAALRGRGVDPGPDFKSATLERPTVVVGIDGNNWEVWGEGLFLFARRERTAAEREQYFDRMNSMFVPDYVSMDKVQLIEYIAIELMATAHDLATVRRGDVRRLRRKLDALGLAQWRLARKPKVSMAQIRADLAAVGFVVPQMRRDEFGQVVH